MKKLALLFLTFALAFSSNAFAQGKYGADSAECIKYLSYYKEYFKQKNYNDALPNWRNAYKYCPATANQTMLIDGTTLLRDLIKKNAANPEYQQALIDSLMTLHDLRVSNYPKYAQTALNNKATDYSNFVKNPQDLFDGYNVIIEANGKNVKASTLLFSLNAAIALYQEGKLDAEGVINTYQRNIAILETIEAKNEIDAAQNAKVKTDIESLFISSKVASCENLIALFTPRYNANPTDEELVSNIVKMLGRTEGCQDNDLFLNAVTSLYKINPSYESAYYLYKLNSSRDNVDDAIKYLEQAIASSESNDLVDGEYNYELALFCLKNNMKSKALDCATKACELNPEYKAKSYFLIGTIWGATTCGGDEIARRAPYWVAVDYLNKAKAADESLADQANELIRQYSKYYPQTAEAFMYDLTDGKPYTVSCGGMKATTTVRTQK